LVVAVVVVEVVAVVGIARPRTRCCPALYHRAHPRPQPHKVQQTCLRRALGLGRAAMTCLQMSLAHRQRMSRRPGQEATTRTHRLRRSSGKTITTRHHGRTPLHRARLKPCTVRAPCLQMARVTRHESRRLEKRRRHCSVNGRAQKRQKRQWQQPWRLRWRRRRRVFAWQKQNAICFAINSVCSRARLTRPLAPRRRLHPSASLHQKR
jgi:hypothetical protein